MHVHLNVGPQTCGCVARLQDEGMQGLLLNADEKASVKYSVISSDFEWRFDFDVFE